MKKRAIPKVPLPGLPRHEFDGALKENMEQIMGQRGSRIAELPSTATLAELIAKVNEVIGAMQ
jgi:hypothetical protein